MKKFLLFTGLLFYVISIYACSSTWLSKQNRDYKNLSYEPQKVELIGLMKLEMFYGSPNYGENPKTDAKEYCFILDLKTPANVITGKDAELYETHMKITDIQIVNKSNINLESFKDRKVKISGTLFSSHTGHHHTKVLINAEKIIEIK